MKKYYPKILCNNHTCTGCGACAQICPNQVIEMKEDAEGFLYPSANLQKCVGCGLCEKSCPVITDKSNSEQNDKIRHSYASTNIDRNYSKDCATIGVCTMAAEWILHNGGLVYGVALDENEWRTFHVCANKTIDLDKIKNSKYVQSDTRDTFRSVKKELQFGKLVLYVGTPCQIAGLKGYLRKDYNNLYTIDLICHGTYSYKLLQKEIQYWERKYKGKVSNFKFRSKRIFPWNVGGIMNFDINRNGHTKHIEQLAPSSPTYRCYAYSNDGKSYNLRPCCYGCQFKDKKRYGDLTVGDAWGLTKICENLFTKANRKSGISSVFTNTNQGVVLLNSIKENLNIVEYPFNVAFCQPALCFEDNKPPKERDYIYRQIDFKEYGNLISSILGVDLDKEQRKAILNYRKCKTKEYIKTILLYKRWKKKE